MGMMYRIKPDIYAPTAILMEPNLPGFNETFLTGASFQQKLNGTLVFQSNFDLQAPPRGFEGMTIPVWSYDFVTLLHNIGVTNFELYDAIIESSKGLKWTNYHAVNVLGTVAAADMTKSLTTNIMTTPNNLPFARFHNLVINANKVLSLDLFRLAESTSTLIISQRVLSAIKDNPRSGGWGITAFPIEQV
ncbi:MAG: hypothetical protein EBR30_24335 [Cytophagia bacterium]|nr:hypothetical protein [Cytophagia bacterium]